MSTFVLGIDIGTSSIKAVALTPSGEVLSSAQASYSLISRQPGYSELDPLIIWTAFISCIKQIIAESKATPALISLSSCMHSLMAVDETGTPLTSVITWMDTRSAAIAQELRQSGEAESLYQNTGTPLHAMSPLCKLAWLLHHEPDLIKRAVRFISIKEFIWHKFFRVYHVDHSIASATGLFDIVYKSWHMPSLFLTGVNPLQLSEPVFTHYTRSDIDPEIATLLGIPPNTPFCIGGSDGCMANVGSYALERGVAALTIGTSGAVRIASPSPIINYPAMTFNYILDEQTYICGGAVNNGGNVLQWLHKQFLLSIEENQYETIFKMVEDVPAGCIGLLFLPYLYGERSPLWDEHAAGCFLGVKAHHSTSFFIRAALEGVCYALNDLLQLMELAAGRIQQVHVSGGFVHSKAWMQLLANITNKPLYLFQSEDASAIGAALFAMKKAGLISNYASARPAQPMLVAPDANQHTLYKQYQEVFSKLYPLLKEPMHQLYALSTNR